MALSLSLFFFPHKRDFSGERGKGEQNKKANEVLGIAYAGTPTEAQKSQLSVSSSPGAAATWGAGASLSHGPGRVGTGPWGHCPQESKPQVSKLPVPISRSNYDRLLQKKDLTPSRFSRAASKGQQDSFEKILKGSLLQEFSKASHHGCFRTQRNAENATLSYQVLIVRVSN